MVLSNIPLFASATIFIGTQFQPTYFWELKGNLVTVPPGGILSFPASGYVIFPDIPGGGGPATFYVQAVVSGLGIPTPLLSNAVRIDLLP